MSKKGISDAQRMKEKLWTDEDFKSGTIKNIRYTDGSYSYIGDNEKKKDKIPVYGSIEVEFHNDSGQPIVTANIPCPLSTAKNYSIGQTCRVELVVDDDTDIDD